MVISRRRTRSIRATAAVFAVATMVAAGSSAVGSQSGEPSGWRHVDTWQSDPAPPAGVLVEPIDITRASDGTLFVTDRGLHRVQRFTPEGEPLAVYGSRGVGDGELSNPHGAAADVGRDRLYVADTGNNRISVFDLAGNFVAHADAPAEPVAVEVAGNGNLFVAGRVSLTTGVLVVYDLTGAELASIPFARPPSEDGGGSAGLARSPSGDVYQAATGGAIRVSASGAVRGMVSLLADANSRDVAVDDGEDVYALHGSSWIYRALSGRHRQLHGGNITAIAGGPKKTMYKAVAATRDERSQIATVQFGATNHVAQRWGDPLTILGWLATPLRMVAGADGDLYTVDEMYRVQRFAPDGSAMGQVTMPGLKEVIAGPDGDLFVARERTGTSVEDPEDPEVPPHGTHRLLLERYRFDGGLVSSREQPTVGSVRWSRSRDESVDSVVQSRFAALELDETYGRLYLLDAGRHSILVFDTEGLEMPSLDLPDRRAGVPAYTDLATAPDGTVFVLHTADRRIVHLDGAGNVLAEWEAPDWAWRLDVLQDGRVAMVTATRWLWVFDANAVPRFVAPLPTSPFDTGEPPSDITVGADGRLYVTDRSASAVFVFAPADEPSMTPPRGRYACEVAAVAQAAPLHASVGEDIVMRVTLSGSCDEHPRNGRQPEVLLRSAEVRVQLPPDFELDLDTVSPPGVVRDGEITWSLSGVGRDGEVLSYTFAPQEAGRRPAFAAASVTYLDGWLTPGALEPSPHYVIVRAGEEPAVRLYLPTAANATEDLRESGPGTAWFVRSGGA